MTKKLNEYEKLKVLKRAVDIARELRTGSTLQSVADKHGITRERVRQIRNHLGIESRLTEIKGRASLKELQRIDKKTRKNAEYDNLIFDLRNLIEVQYISILEAGRALNIGRGKCFHICKKHKIISTFNCRWPTKPPLNTKS